MQAANTSINRSEQPWFRVRLLGPTGRWGHTCDVMAHGWVALGAGSDGGGRVGSRWARTARTPRWAPSYGYFGSRSGIFQPGIYLSLRVAHKTSSLLVCRASPIASLLPLLRSIRREQTATQRNVGTSTRCRLTDWPSTLHLVHYPTTNATGHLLPTPSDSSLE